MTKLTTLETYKDKSGNEIISAQKFETSVTITFKGKNNRLIVDPGTLLKKINVNFDCDNGTLVIGESLKSRGGEKWNIRVGQDSTVRIGKNVSTTSTCLISAVEGTSVTIGDDVMLATANQIRSDDAHAIYDVATGDRLNKSSSISIGNHVWLAYGVCVLSGAQIGDGSVIGFKSLVTSNIPNNCVAVGQPARVVRKNTAWERPHLSLHEPFYKPNAKSVKKSPYWRMTEESGPQAVNQPHVEVQVSRLGWSERLKCLLKKPHR